MTALISISFAIFGAILASFLGVVAERIHTGQSWQRGRSRCNSCRTILTARDLFPVLSWVLNGGRCRTCGSRVPVRYSLFELTLALAFAGAYATLGWGIPLVLLLVAMLLLGFIVLYDLRHTIVPMEAATALIFVSAAFGWLTSSSLADARYTLIVAALIAFFFIAFHVLSRGRAMGLGDAPIAFALSLLVGAAAIPGLLFSFWIGALVGIGILVARPGGPTMGIEVPFVPFLALGYLLAYFTAWNPLPF